MSKTGLEELKRKHVEVRANGIVYRGMLLEVTDKEVTLRGATGFVTIPIDRVTAIYDPKARKTNSQTTFVDKSFYDADIASQPKTETEK